MRVEQQYFVSHNGLLGTRQSFQQFSERQDVSRASHELCKSS